MQLKMFKHDFSRVHQNGHFTNYAVRCPLKQVYYVSILFPVCVCGGGRGIT